MDEIKEIVKTLTDWRNAYYNGEPQASDAEFDDLEDKLRQLDPENEYFSGIGEDASDGFPKAKHVLLMGSQDKCNTVEDIVKKLKHFAGKKVALLVEPKCDGLSLEMNYKEGKLVSIITRGDGYEGDDVTSNKAHIMGIPDTIPSQEDVSFRGEVMILKSDMANLFPEMKNTRNCASGLLKRKSW